MQHTTQGDSTALSWSFYLSSFCLVFYLVPVAVGQLGQWMIRRNYSRPLKPSLSSRLPKAPHVTVLRPMTGLEPNLYECLVSTFQQDYPLNRFTIHLCIPSRRDSAYSTALRVIEQYPEYDAHLFVEEDEIRPEGYGPNPKIGNLSRAYREAKDLVWIVDCNVWISKGSCGRMVDRLMGYGAEREFKFVHQLPVVVSTSDEGHFSRTGQAATVDTDVPFAQSETESFVGHAPESFGGRLDEAFLCAAHAKFYTAINTVSVAPCIVGKSNMFRKAHLDALTLAEGDKTRPFVGLDYFSTTICEDHLLADMLWYRKLPAFLKSDKSWGHHGLLHGDPAIQPVSQMSLAAYAARRARWLRVRKFVVPAATLVEPLTESFVCNALGAQAATSLPVFAGIIPTTWSTFGSLWLLGITVWMLGDWSLYQLLQSMPTVELDGQTPPFARPRQRPFSSWFQGYIVREAMAFPVWAYAIFGGTQVQWRGKKFSVGLDMRVHAIDGASEAKQE